MNPIGAHSDPAGGSNNGLHLELPDTAPKIIWIELTSRCPFACSFCTRKNERGAGEHMKFDLYASVIEQLNEPEIIRLNYSGESLHYPRLPEAIRLARNTGATTELVTALGSAPRQVIESVVDAGLHRLSVSLHTLDPVRYRRIYGHGDVGAVRDRLQHLRSYQARRGTGLPDLDFAFVAMHDNLVDLSTVVEYASSLGVRHVSIHPVIRRRLTTPAFLRELDDNDELRDDFSSLIVEEVEKARSAHRDLTIAVARPTAPIGAVQDGWVTTCEQNPWNTIHVLADGSVVPCEVQDKSVLGKLGEQSLREIWYGEKYVELRRRYLDGSHAPCRRCPWRVTANYRSPPHVPVWGWHSSSQESAQWSERSAALGLLIPPAASQVVLTGLLPPGQEGNNTLSVGLPLSNRVDVVNSTSELLPFKVKLPAPRQPVQSPSVVSFHTTEQFCPAERNAGPDLRRLGFALTGLSFEFDARRSRTVEQVSRLLTQIERVARFRSFRSSGPPRSGVIDRGVSVLVPARGPSHSLDRTLALAEASLKRVSEESEILVVVSEHDRSEYDPSVRRHPRIRWICRRSALHYVQAVRLGLNHTRFPWVYLLNSDMYLEPEALAALLPLRKPRTFAVGSRIVMEDGSATETNWTDLMLCDRHAAQVVERIPHDLEGARGCLYVGGGSGLFRSSLLKKFLPPTQVYAPFYWEDVEWGARAWRNGYESVFCPHSRAVHGHRQTVRRYYKEAEISRIFERNRLMFHLRNLPDVHSLNQRLLELDEQTWREIFNPAVLARAFAARTRAFLSPLSADVLQNRCAIRF